MICPYCNNEMQSGYIKACRNIFFDKVKDANPNMFTKNAISLGKFWELTQIECYYCDSCEKFIFDNPRKK